MAPVENVYMEIELERMKDEQYRAEVFSWLVRNYQDRIFHYCIVRLGAVYGEEVAQEVFVTAWEILAKFRHASTLETWLTGIAKHKCMQAFRNRTRRQAMAKTFVDDIRAQAHSTVPGSPEDMLIDQHQFVVLAHGLARLRDDERLLLNLRYYKGLQVAEVADLMGKSEVVVRKRLLRTLQRLRALIDAATSA